MPLPVFVILIYNSNSKPYYSQSQEIFSIFEKIFSGSFAWNFHAFLPPPGDNVKKVLEAIRSPCERP